MSTIVEQVRRHVLVSREAVACTPSPAVVGVHDALAHVVCGVEELIAALVDNAKFGTPATNERLTTALLALRDVGVKMPQAITDQMLRARRARA